MERLFEWMEEELLRKVYILHFKLFAIFLRITYLCRRSLNSREAVMKKIVGLLLYTTLFAFASNACQFQGVFAIPGYKDFSVLAFQQNDDSDSNQFGFIASVEEFESNEEDPEPEASNSSSCLASNCSKSLLSGNYFTDFLTTAVIFVPKRPLYICYSSLKIPSLV